MEPDVEYYIQITNNSNKTCSVDVKIDKRSIEDGRRLLAGETKRLGVWERLNDSNGLKLTERALKFRKAMLVRNRNKETNSSSMWTGQVTAIFHECSRIWEVYSEWVPSGNVKSQVDNCEEMIKKGVETERGVTELSSYYAAPPREQFPTPPSSPSLTLRYCSTVGLIYHKVLPQPPGSTSVNPEYKRPLSQDDQEKVPEWRKKVKGGMVKIQETCGSNKVTRECYQIDLTEVDSDQE